MSEEYKVGDLVWAKMKGFSPWPSRISKPTADHKKPSKKSVPVQFVYFFGSNNYAWIEESNIKPYHEYKDRFILLCKTTNFKDACKQIEDYIVDKERFPDLDQKMEADMEFDKLRHSSVDKHKEKKPKKDSPAKRKSSSAETLPPKKNRVSLNNSVKHDSDKSNHVGAQKNYEVLLDRTIPEASKDVPSVGEIEKTSAMVLNKDIEPSDKSFGFLGIGIMGSGLVKNLLLSGHKVCIWNREPSKCEPLVAQGATMKKTPMDVVESADIIFSCVSDPQVAKELVFGNCGVLRAPTICNSKGYVELTSIDAETSQDIAEAITFKGGRYLEAAMQGSKNEADSGTLVILTAGDKGLFKECQSCFQAIGKSSFFFDDVGNASKMNLILQLMRGVTLAGIAEGMALAHRAGLQIKDVQEVLQLTSMSCPAILDKTAAMITGEFPTKQPLMHMQKDLNLSLEMGNQLQLPLPLTATANEVFKHARRMGYGEHDVSAVYVRARF